MCDRIKHYWNKHFFNCKSAEFLALQRILFFGFLSYYTLFFESLEFSSWRSLPDALWLPVSVFSILDSPPFSFEFLKTLEVLWPWILVLSAVGFFTRIFTSLSFLIHFIFVGCSLSYGEGSFDQLLTSVYLLIFAISPSGNAISIDKLIFNKNVNKASVDYYWPVRLQQWMFCAFFMGAAVSKLSASGLTWIFSDTLSNYMIFAHYRMSISYWMAEIGLGLWLASISWLSKSLAASTIFLELFSPLAIFLNRVYKKIFILAHLFMSISFYFVLTEGFFNIVVFYFCWFADLFYKLFTQYFRKREH